MKPQIAESSTCDMLFAEMVDMGVADMAEERDLRATVAEARRAAALRNGPNQAPTTPLPQPPTWPLEPGSLAEAIYWYRQLAGEGEYTQPEHIITALSNLGFSWRHRRRWADAEAAFHESLQLRRAYGDRAGEGQTYWDLGQLYQAQGRWAEAEAAFTQSLAVAREVGERWTEAAALGDLGVTHAALGQVEKAIDCLEQAIALAHALGDAVLAQRMRAHLARIAQRS